MGIIGKEIVVSDAEFSVATSKLAATLLEGRAMLTVFCGKDAGADEQSKLEAFVAETRPDAEIYFLDGGQDVYPFIFVAE